MPKATTILRCCRSIVSVAAIVSASTALAATPEIRIVTSRDMQPTTVEVFGLPAVELARAAKLEPGDALWPQLLTICVLDTDGKLQNPPLVGRYEIVGETVRFTPLFRFRAGMSYEAQLHSISAD